MDSLESKKTTAQKLQALQSPKKKLKGCKLYRAPKNSSSEAASSKEPSETTAQYYNSTKSLQTWDKEGTNNDVPVLIKNKETFDK